MEKYMVLSWGDHIVFKDSYQFLTCSLEELASNLLKAGRGKFKQFLAEFQGQSADMLLRKGVYPYDYMDSPDRFNEHQLPPKDAFFSKLRDAGITDEDYQHAQRVWTEFGCTRMLDYHNIYLKSMLFFNLDFFWLSVFLARIVNLEITFNFINSIADVLLLADVFEAFRDVSLGKL